MRAATLAFFFFLLSPLCLTFHIQKSEERVVLSPLQTLKPSSHTFAYIHLAGISTSYHSHKAVCILDIKDVVCAVRSSQMTYGFSTSLTHANKTPVFKVNK